MVSQENFEAFVNLFVKQFQTCYFWLSSIQIAGLTMFEWILGFMAAGAIFTIIRAFARAGGVSTSGMLSGGFGAAEKIQANKKDKGGK